MHPFLWPTVGLAAGILAFRLTPLDWTDAALTACSFGLLAEWARWHTVSAWLRRALWTLFFAGVGVGAAWWHRPGPLPWVNAAAKEVVVISGCVVESPAWQQDRGRFLLEIEPGILAQVSLYLREGDTPPVLHYGQRVEFEGRIRRPGNFRNPGAFDYAAYLEARDIYFLASGRVDAQVRTLPGDCGTRWGHVIDGVRGGILQRLEAHFGGDPRTLALLSALLIGHGANLERSWTEDFRRTGTYHAIVISGLHFSFLTLTLFLLFRVLTPSPTARLVAGLALGWTYAAVAGMSAPVMRAAALMSLFLVARFLYREGRLLNLLCVSAFGCLLAAPWLLFDASFQLSFAAVTALAVITVPWTERTIGLRRRACAHLDEPARDVRLPRMAAAFRVELRLLAETLALLTPVAAERWMRGARVLAGAYWVLEMVLTSVVMQVALAVPMILYFHRISWSSVSANLIIVPLLNACIPLGFLAAATGWTPVVSLTHLLMSGASNVAHWHVARLPDVRTPDPPAWLMAAFVTALLGWAATAGSRWRWAGFGGVLVVFGVMVAHPFAPLVSAREMELSVMDVSQGDALFLAVPDGPRPRLMVIDGGGFLTIKGRKPGIDTGEDVISPYLWSRGIQRLDVLVSTHAHEDHTGGLPALLENFRPRELWTGANPQSPTWRAVEEKARTLGIRVRAMHAGEVFDYGEARVTVVSPAPDYVPAPQPRNADSLGFAIQYGKRSFLLTGDLERPNELRMLAERWLPRVDVLKVAHHGSRTSTTAAFLEEARPAFAVISVGEQNFFRHPSPVVLRALDEAHVAVYRTDRDGLVSLFTDGRGLRVETWLGSPRPFSGWGAQ